MAKNGVQHDSVFQKWIGPQYVLVDQALRGGGMRSTSDIPVTFAREGEVNKIIRKHAIWCLSVCLSVCP